NLNGNDEWTRQCFHTGKPNVLGSKQGAAEIREIVELCEFTYFAFIIEVSDEPVLSIRQNVRVYRGHFLSGVYEGDAIFRAFFCYPGPRLREILLPPDQVVRLFYVYDNVGWCTTCNKRIHRSIEYSRRNFAAYILSDGW